MNLIMKAVLVLLLFILEMTNVLYFFLTLYFIPGNVVFYGSYVTMTCPNGTKLYNEKNDEVENSINYIETPEPKYHCEGDAIQFYIKGKGCPNCYDLNATFLGIVIGLDLAVTTFLMFIVHYFAKGRSPSTPQKSKMSIFFIPPACLSQRFLLFRPLNIGSRSRDTYAAVNRMG
uniref:CD3 gamma/delta subunit Ig-like domain-containing protein n=1 Tax=Denticeps clupeoides TaxID=299321 RepID=A0A8C4FZF8_9TELE